MAKGTAEASSKARSKKSSRGKGASSKSASVAIKGSEYLQTLIDGYLAPDDIEVSSSVEASSEAECISSSVNSISSNTGKAQDVDVSDCCRNEKVGKTQTEHCRRKRRGINCVHGFCFQCCLETPLEPNAQHSFCAGHLAMKLKKDLEDRYVEEGLNRKLLNRSKFFSYEDRFTNTQQTVTIWCSRDFYMNKAFSAEVMADVANAERRLEAKRKRKGTFSTASAAESVTISSSTIESLTSVESVASRQLVNPMAKAWCIVREKESADRQMRWQQYQQSWLQEQKNKGTESTAWILNESDSRRK